MIRAGDCRLVARNWVAAGLMTGLMLSATACNRRGGTSTAAPPAAVAVTPPPAPAKPATRPAATVTIDGHLAAFPAAKLVLSKKPDGLDAVLCSDDPPTAIQSTYGGNSFFFEMRLDIADPSDLDGAIWNFKVPDHQAGDSPNGIFLDGARRQLEPAEVRVSFERRGEQVVANLNGRFLVMEQRDPGAPPRSVQVSAALDALVQQE